MRSHDLKLAIVALSALALMTGPARSDDTSPVTTDSPAEQPSTTDAPTTDEAGGMAPANDDPIATADAAAKPAEADTQAMSDQAAKEAYAAAMAAYQNGDLETARTKLEAALPAFASDPARKAEVRTSLARVLVERAPDGNADTAASRDRDEALRLASEATEIHASGEAYNVKGRVLLEMEQHDDAIAAFERAVELDEDNLYAMNNLGYAMILQGKFEAAREPLEKANDLASTEAPGYFYNNLGIVREKTGDLAGAREAYATADARGNRNAAANLERVQEKLRAEPAASEAMNTEAAMDDDASTTPPASPTDTPSSATPGETPGQDPNVQPQVEGSETPAEPEGSTSEKTTETTTPGQ